MTPKNSKEGYEEVQNQFNFWSPEAEGDSLTGTVVNWFKGKYSRAPVIETENGDRWVTPSHTVLNSLMNEVEIGDNVLIEFEGTQKSEKGSDTRMYKLYKKK